MVKHLLLIGAQKAGSTYLHNLIAQDSKVAAHPKKEPMYFSKPKYVGTDYHSMFEISERTEVILDSSASYLHVEGTAERILNELGDDAVIAAILRDPWQRAVSAYLHNVKHGRDLRSAKEVFDFDATAISEARAEESERIERAGRRGLIDIRSTEDSYFDPAFSYRYFSNSLYYEQLEPFLGRFKNLILVDFKNLLSEPARVADSIRTKAGLFSAVDYDLQVPTNKTKFNRWTALRRRRNIDTQLPWLVAARRLFTQRYDHLQKRDFFLRFPSLADYQELISEAQVRAVAAT